MKKERKATTLDEVKKVVIFIQYEIQRPFVFVKAEAKIDGHKWIGLGFAKVCWPDIWNPTIGFAIAERKAIEHIARAVSQARYIERVGRETEALINAH